MINPCWNRGLAVPAGGLTGIALTAALAATGCAPIEDSTASQPSASVKQGDLPTLSPTLVYDGTKWAALSSARPMNPPDATASPNFKLCDPNKPVWKRSGKTFAYLPVRLGPTPWQLDDCWAGDALDDGTTFGPGDWADDTSQSSVTSPSVARVGSKYFLYYSAINAALPSQRCIGKAEGSSPIGPTWTHRATAVHCPSNGQSALDPELFFDRVSDAWFLAWAETVNCDSKLLVQRIDSTTGALVTGTPQELLNTATTLGIAFADIPVERALGCPNNVVRRITNPSLVRADTNHLWVLFSGNLPRSNDYATGWALCGSGEIGPNSSCGVTSGFDPTKRYKPMWGAANRTAPSGFDATPFYKFPNTGPFGGLSLAVSNPIAAAPPRPDRPGLVSSPPVYAIAEGTASSAHVLRLDTTAVTYPGLFEPDTITWYGNTGSFSSQLTEPQARTPSGQAVTAREVPNFAWRPGTTGLFNAVSADGAFFAGGLPHDASNNLFPSTDETTVGVFDPKISTWTNVRVPTMGGALTVPGRVSPYLGEDFGVIRGGGFTGDVQAIDGGNAIAFTVSAGWPLAYAGVDPKLGTIPVPSAGPWPSFGILTKVAGQWQVQDKWSGKDLVTASGNSNIARQACPENPGVLPPGESVCRAPNEMAHLPRSRVVIVTQYLGSNRPGENPNGAIMALQYDKLSNGRYTVKITGFYQVPMIPDLETSDPNDFIKLQTKEVHVDPSGVLGDERFLVNFDLSRAGAPNNPPPNRIIEFRYNANAAPGDVIQPTSAPFVGAGGRYDKDGNLWSPHGNLRVYAKGPNGRKISSTADIAAGGCGFKPSENATLRYYEGNVWGVTCPADYEIVQQQKIHGPMEYMEDPRNNVMVGIHIGATDPENSQLLPVRYKGSGASMTFEIGNVTATGLNYFGGLWHEFRPGAFDEAGRLWFIDRLIDHTPPEQVTAHRIAAVDTRQLFDQPPVVLKTGMNEFVVVQAENTSFSAARTPPCPSPPAVCPTRLIDSDVLVQSTSKAFGVGLELITGAAGVGHVPGAAEYKVWAPQAGNYHIIYDAKGPGGSTIVCQIDGVAATPAPRVDNTEYALVGGPTRFLSAGLHTLRLSRGGSTAGWTLDAFLVKRVLP